MLPITPRPCVRPGVYVSTASSLVRIFASSYPVVALRIELSATWLSASFGPPALGYREPKSGWQDSNLRLRAPKARGFATTLNPVCQSERPDSNRRSPAPRAGAIPRLRYVLLLTDPCGSRTHPVRLERPMTSPEVERPVRAPSTQLFHWESAHSLRSGSGGARIRVPSFSARC